jgi:hypothetical protein
VRPGCRDVQLKHFGKKSAIRSTPKGRTMTGQSCSLLANHIIDSAGKHHADGNAARGE